MPLRRTFDKEEKGEVGPFPLSDSPVPRFSGSFYFSPLWSTPC